MKNVIGIVVSYFMIGIVIIVSNFFKRYGKETSRKFIHIMLANWWIIAIIFFENALWACVVPLSFVIINFISYKKNLIKIMERDEKDRTTEQYIMLYLYLFYQFLHLEL